MATIQNERDKLLQSAAIRVVAIANTSISSNVGSFVLTPSTGVITPASATITVKVDTYTAPIYQWYKFKDGVATALVGQTSSTLTVASSGFAVFVGSGTSGTYRVIVSQAGYPTETLDYTFLLVRDGAQGASGLPGLSVVAVASAFSFTFSGTGAVNPSSIICSLQRPAGINGSASGSDYVWTVASGSFSGSLATINSNTGAFASFSESAMQTDAVTFKCVYTVSTAGSDYLGKSYTSYITITKTKPGSKSTTVSAFQWALSTPTVSSTNATYTWSNGSISPYPSAWSSSPPTSPGSGYILYQLNVRVTESDGGASSTVFNWSSGSIGTIGYREDGSIGPQGSGSRIAYIVTTSGTPPALGATQPVNADTLPNGSARPGSTALNTWSATPKSVLSEGEFMYQSDGVYDPSTNKTTWQPAYLSNLKVGNLSALSAKLGVVEIAASGALYSGKTSSSSTAAGFHLGYSGSAYTFFIGDNGDTKSLKWDGTDLKVKGGSIEGATFKSVVGSGGFTLTGYNFAGKDSSNITRLNITALGQGDFRPQAGDAITAVGVGAASGVNASSSSAEGVLGSSFSGVGVFGSGVSTATGVKGSSSSGFGGEFTGNATRANLKITPVASLPSNREAGSICVYNGNLCIANGTHWFTFTGLNQLT